MSSVATILLPDDPDDIAPDGSEVRLLCGLDGGGTAEFLLPPGRVSRAVAHRTVEEIWFVMSGEGELWRSLDGDAVHAPLTVGTSITIPVGTSFQFRSAAEAPLRILGVTIPPWPGEHESMSAEGPWVPTVD